MQSSTSHLTSFLTPNKIINNNIIKKELNLNNLIFTI